MKEDESTELTGRIRCRRTGQDYSPDEHERCPYCFGTENVIERGRYEEFCDFRPGVDPVSFGLPADALRHRQG